MSQSKPVSPAKALFLGEVLEDRLFPFPSIGATERETLKMVIESVDRFLEGRESEFRDFDKHGQQAKEYIDSLKELGLFGLIIPEDFGGIGLSNSGYSRVLQQITRYDGSTSLTVGAHSSIGMKGLLLFGTPEQKKRYLPKLASGETIAAFCLTEPGSGSDAASIKTEAEKQSDGSYILNGEKIWITNGAFAEFFTVFAKTKESPGAISAFIVERSFAGVSTGPKEDKMGIRASATTAVVFNNVRVPAENLLGEAGKGFKVAMAILNNGRTGLGGGCVGAMKAVLKHATAQAAERKQFGRPIAEYGLIKEKLAQIAVNCYATESVVAMLGHYIDSGEEDFSVEAAISKVFASEALWQSSNDGLQIAGGNGFMREYPYERIVRDSRINLIFEGTNEILRLYIAFGGLKEAGSYLKQVGKSAGQLFKDPFAGFEALTDYAAKKVSQYTPIGRDSIKSVHPELRPLAEIIEHLVPRLAIASEAVLKRYGKELESQQFLVKRLADIAIDIFVALCVLSRTTKAIEKKGVAATKNEQHLTRLFVQQAKRRARTNLRRLVKNEDDSLQELANYVSAEGGFVWDALDE